MILFTLVSAKGDLLLNHRSVYFMWILVTHVRARIKFLAPGSQENEKRIYRLKQTRCLAKCFIVYFAADLMRQDAASAQNYQARLATGFAGLNNL
jgi:hypothetical protein